VVVVVVRMLPLRVEPAQAEDLLKLILFYLKAMCFKWW
jgi:hypothetical protein